MDTIKKGNTLIIIFILITIVLFIGLHVLRIYTFYNDVVNQQHRYWYRYYSYEGCVNYALAYFYTRGIAQPITIPYTQKNNRYMVHINSAFLHDNCVDLLISIEEKNNVVATAHITLEKNNELWVIKNRALKIQSSIDLDKKALLPYTKILKS